ncbi:hypothetical protein BDV24DRAFT_140375 [Aspergillus arachidicola]|uniref:Uncharacterized protein n=1 Tax=Aspergillus arachidicola TaxID=656916 RepID=A0A5N6XVR4_9EURO|nr:hypothetical protein BDV24DRAFT_140375 [Aspergillus arachidicola]
MCGRRTVFSFPFFVIGYCCLYAYIVGSCIFLYCFCVIAIKIVLRPLFSELQNCKIELLGIN